MLSSDSTPLSVRIIQSRFQSNRNPEKPNESAPPADPSPSHHPTQQFQSIRSLSEAPFVSSYSRDASFLTCAEEFFEDNPLIAATLQPATQVKYGTALEKFRDSRVANECTHLSLDHRLSIYIQERYMCDARPGQRQEMSNLICILILMYPSLRVDFGLARRCISGWKALKPSQSSAPFTKELVLALAWILVSKKQFASATVLMTSFAACLRVSEALKLTWANVALPGDVRLSAFPPGTAGLNIKDAKTSRYTGKLQFVKLSDPHGIKLLDELHKSISGQNDNVAAITYQKYALELNSALKHFKLDHSSFTTHSARIGKATEDFIKGEPVEQIAINGRWKSLSSLRYYLNNGKAWILNTKMTLQQQATIKQSARQMQTALR